MPINPYLPMYQQYQQMLQQPQMSNAGNFVSVPNETAARNYPIAPGNSVTFIDENSPYCYTKTMGLNQLDRPVFKRYRLVEEEDMLQSAQNSPQTGEQTQASTTIPDEIKGDINALRALYEKLRADVDDIKGAMAHGKSTVSAAEPE